jgi:hypothetical protein
MWLILLDASGSMADPFEQSAPFAGRQRVTATQTKIDAAKEALLLHLKGLGVATRVAIFAFRDTAELLYDGSTADIPQIHTVLDQIDANGGTNVASALTAARDHLDAQTDQFMFRVLLISDGLSSAAPAEAASKDLLDRRVPVDIILIDPSEKGNELARHVAGAVGSVTAVTSAETLEAAVGEAGAAIGAEAAAVEQARDSLRRSLAEFQVNAQGEELSFTAAYPSELAKDSWGSVILFIHLSSLLDEARKRARGLGQVKGADMLSSSVPGSTRLPRGTEITLTPRLPGFDFNPMNITVAWEEDIQSSEFRVRPTLAPEEPLIGEIEASVKGLPIARIPLSILVRSPKAPRPAALEPKVSTGGAFQTVFASYARTDTAVVQACAAVYAGLGIYVIIDKQALIAGQSWRPALRALLAGADAFQLFWSGASSVSPEVGEEISDALTIQGERGTGFIRPVYWSEPCTPQPSELKHLNFAYLDLDRLQEPEARGKTNATPAVGRETPLKGAPGIPVTVLPLLPDLPARTTHEIREDVAFAVAFIEETVGSRYYPVPTLLVDHYTVQAVRADETVDFATLDEQQRKALTEWGHVLSSICLCFHVRNFWDGLPYEATVETARNAGLDKPAFYELKRLCEWAPRSWFVPAWHDERTESIPGLSEARTLEDAVARILTAAASTNVDAEKALRIADFNIDNQWAAWESELAPLGLAYMNVGSKTMLTGTGASFLAGLNHLRAYIEPFIAGSNTRFAERPNLDERLPAALDILNDICEGLFGTRYYLPSLGLKSMILREISHASAWTGARAALAEAKLPGVSPDQDFPHFAAAFFDSVGNVLRQRLHEGGNLHVNNRFGIPAASWERLRLSKIAEELHGAPKENGQVQMEGPISSFIDALDGAWKAVDDLLRTSLRTGPPQYFVTDVPTYGIFAPAGAVGVDIRMSDKASDWGLPRPLTLPGTDRVLLCGDALDDFQAVLNKQGLGHNAARLFLRSVLVHEHFHAFAQTAPMEDGAPPPGPRFRDHWNDASPVNESIAAWMQLHMARDDVDVRERVWDYIRSGAYPQWPYAGAAIIEDAYGRQGIEEVRSLIRLLRTDPLAATAWMRERMAGGQPVQT